MGLDGDSSKGLWGAGVLSRGRKGSSTGIPESRWVNPQSLCDHHVQVGQAFLEAAVVRGRLVGGRDKGKKVSSTEPCGFLASPVALGSC